MYCSTIQVLKLSAFSIVYAVLQAQCNVFKGASGEVALTAGGGLRQLPGLTETFENAALVLFHGNFSINVSGFS